MADTEEPKDIQEYAGGWITERKGTEVPGFLKLAFIVIAGGALTYFFLFMWGETTHSDRGVLVRQLNAATEASTVFMYAIAAMIVVFAVILAMFALRKSHHE
jgi:hypothetical protein